MWRIGGVNGLFKGGSESHCMLSDADRLPQQMSRMSCFGCTDNRELRVLVMGTDGSDTDGLVKEIQESSGSDSRANICCCPSKGPGVPVTIGGLHLLLIDTRTLCESDVVAAMIDESKQHMSASARRVFLLVLNRVPSDGETERGQEDKEKEMVQKIKKTFGEDESKNMVVVFKKVQSSVDELKNSLDQHDPELRKLLVDCHYVTDENGGSFAKAVKNHIRTIAERPDKTCCSLRMMEAQRGGGRCQWENFSLPTKVCLLVLGCVALAAGYFLYCWTKQLIETAAAAASKRIMDASQ